jgi:hypothetical protein
MELMLSPGRALPERVDGRDVVDQVTVSVRAPWMFAAVAVHVRHPAPA